MVEIKNKVALEIKKEERVYHFECASNGSLGEIFDVLCEMKGWVVEKIQEDQKRQEEARAKAQEDQPKEEQPQVA